jgi:hypothetical protein
MGYLITENGEVQVTFPKMTKENYVDSPTPGPTAMPSANVNSGMPSVNINVGGVPSQPECPKCLKCDCDCKKSKRWLWIFTLIIIVLVCIVLWMLYEDGSLNSLMSSISSKSKKSSKVSGKSR